jgi:D-alanyl-D-alanine carboxypeptidase/D-alanyl-D-alanine-endopeptidase (penicillin-binding protein 4)
MRNTAFICAPPRGRAGRIVLAGLLIGLATASLCSGEMLKDVNALIGPKDAILVTGPAGEVLLQKNTERPLVPASILKIFTSLVAIHHLGLDFRFATEFYLDDAQNLTIKGYGDPLLISETVADIARALATITTRINDIVVDDSLFVQPLEIPGVSSSSEPYDAPNGALCVNFNTIYFKREKNRLVSAEPQTPLLPIALERIRSSKLQEGRIVLSHDESQVARYAGHLFEYFLQQSGLAIMGKVRIGKVRPDIDRLVYRYLSAFTLRDIITKLLEYSNNYITNQILIAAGIAAYGPPGSLEKGVRAARLYGRDILQTASLHLNEGSGISRENRVTARDMLKILDAFAPYHTLMRNNGRLFYKTGTLHGISTRAGYIQNGDGELYRFVVMLNSPGKSAERVTRQLVNHLQ